MRRANILKWKERNIIHSPFEQMKNNIYACVCDEAARKERTNSFQFIYWNTESLIKFTAGEWPMPSARLNVCVCLFTRTRDMINACIVKVFN